MLSSTGFEGNIDGENKRFHQGKIYLMNMLRGLS